MPQNFSFIIEGKLCAMERPGTYAPMEEDCAFLEHKGVRAIVSLTEQGLDRKVLEAHGFVAQHLPVRDFTPPTLEQCLSFARQVDEWSAAGLAVMVHCGAGYGRTGTMLGAYRVWLGLSAPEAIRRVRQARPMSIETQEQEFAIREFEAYLERTDPRRNRRRPSTGEPRRG